MNNFNDNAWQILQENLRSNHKLNVAVESRPCGAQIIDCGVNVRGGLEAGILMARVGMAGMSEVGVYEGYLGDTLWQWVDVRSDEPLEACLLSQAAHWFVDVGAYKAMGSGPACLLRGKGEIIEAHPVKDNSSHAVLVLETRTLPEDAVCKAIAKECHVEPSALSILVAPTSSLAGSIQVGARMVETALHKLHYLKFDFSKLVMATGRCPIAMPTGDDTVSLGKTNDAVIFGSLVWMAVTSLTQKEIEEWAAKIPSSQSPNYGEPFLQTLKKAGGFYNIDPGLFAPAEVTLVSLEGGKPVHAGKVDTHRLYSALLE
ncbi:MAG TPA: methenyltetrahydromethanopterin cyclohydrolase [Longilinea sp.]|nr:methenyltetrahydromethanopterin cyclohydrolase [Longilinea sp.]